MALQKFDGMDINPEDVLLALCYRYSVLHESDGWIREVIVRAYDDYHDASSTSVQDKAQWIDRAIDVYEKERELPTFAMSIGATWIKDAHKQEFIAVFRKRKHERKMANGKDSQAERRILQREVSENRGGDGLPVTAIRSAK